MLSEAPEGWNKAQLGDCFSVKSSKRVLQKQWRKEGVPFYRGREITSLAEEGFVDNELFIEQQLYEEFASKHGVPHCGDILITAIGTIGNTYVVREGDKFYFKDASVLWLERASENLSALVNYWFQSDLFFNQLDVGNGTTVDSLTISKLKSLTLALPPLNEQHRIAEILSSVDASIQATQTVIEQAERVKRGLMEELLTGGLGSEAIERGEVPEGCEAKKLGDLLEGMDGGVSVNSQSEPASCEEKGILKTSCVSNSFFDASENKVVPDEKEIQRLREPVQAETIIFSRMNTPKLVGANAFVPVSHKNLFLPDRLWALKPISEVKPRWLGFYMSYLFSNGVFEALGTGTSGSMKNISKSKLKEVSIAVPPEVEQERIAEILSGADDFIAKQKTTIEQQNRTKRGLMDDLLTGKVRTV